MMSILTTKNEFCVSRGHDHTYFNKGEEFVVLSQSKKEAILKHRGGMLTFRFPVSEIDKNFSVRIV